MKRVLTLVVLAALAGALVGCDTGAQDSAAAANELSKEMPKGDESKVSTDDFSDALGGAGQVSGKKGGG